MDQGHMICEPIFEDSVKTRYAGKYLIREGRFPNVQEVG